MKTTRLIHTALLLALSSGFAQQPPIPRPQPPKPGAHKPGSNTGGSATDFDLPTEFRSVDGSANNTANAAWGTPGQAFIRLAPAEYADGASSPAGATRPSARAVSNAVVKQPVLRPNARGASDMIWQWGQFIDHDLDETMTATPAEAFPILVPTGDPSFDPTSTGTATIPLSRSIYTMASGKREQTNAITAYIDASMVYGSDAARATGLRALDGTGRLKVSEGDLLPFNTAGLPNAPPGATFYLAGDVRVNEQIGLTAIHTLFVREHNYWASEYQKVNPGVDDEETYQFARMIVAAEIQAITYREFLPVLIGNALPAYRGYDATVNTGVSNEFATAAYRLGHTLLSPQILLRNADGSDVAGTPLALRNAFFNLPVYASNGIDPILRGLVSQRAQELDEWLVDDVRDFLFGAPGSGGFDLASLNIQRGRDHGLPSFANMRKALKLPPVTRFEDINRDRTVLGELRAAYTSPADVDLWVGGLAEADRPGSMVGETFTRILADQFRRCRDGDRFWYQHYLPRGLVRAVEQQTLASIIRRNTGIKTEISDTAFLAPPPRRGGR
jgi:peroxidase